jgi:hypothetical protein
MRPAWGPAASTGTRRITVENQEETQMPTHPRHWLLVIVVDVLVLVEVGLAMYLASLRPDDFELVFMKRFFGMLVPTLILAFLAKRRMRPAPEQSVA